MNHLWQSTLFAIAAGLLTLAFRKNRARVRYGLWLIASYKFLVPFSLLMSFGSGFQRIPATKTIAARVVSSSVVQITQPISDNKIFVASSRGSIDWALIAVLAVWGCGFGMVALTRLRGWWRVRAAVRASFPLEIPATFEIRSSPGLLEPGVVGFFRPILLLPTDIVKGLTPRQLEAVLAHELFHIRYRDNLASAIHMMVEAVFWFHPMVWWIGARLLEKRERACDEGVLSLGSDPHVYAEAILNICKLFVESPLVCVSGIPGPISSGEWRRSLRTALGKS